jgi:hypothetical protein
MEPKELTNTKIIAVLEQPKNYQNWLVSLCEKELVHRAVDPKEVLRLAELVFKNFVQDYLQRQSYYSLANNLKYESRFLSAEQVRVIYERELDEYRSKKKIMNWNLPSG